MSLSSSHDRGMGILLGGIILLLGVTGFIMLYGAWTDTNDTLGTKKNTLTALEARMASLTALAQDAAHITTTTTQKINALIPASLNIPSLLENLEVLAQLKGLILTSVTVNPSHTTNTITTSEVMVEFSGTIDYATWKSLLTSLETNLRLTELVSAQFNPTKPSLSLSIKTFSLQPEENPRNTAFPQQVLNNPELERLTPLAPSRLNTTSPGSSNPFVHPLPPPLPPSH